MSTVRRRALMFVLLAMGLAWGRPAAAQTDEEFFQTFPLNFSNPGARAQAMGGAFIAVADDASSAVTNPAGLTNLTRQQAYFEYKGLSAPVAKLNSFDSLITGVGPVQAPFKSLPGFVNFARPINDKMTVAVSYHQFLAYQNQFTLDARRIIALSAPVFPEVNANVSFRGDSVSGAIGYTVAPKLKVGGAVSWNRLDASVDAVRNNRPVQSGGSFFNSFTPTDPWCGTSATATGGVTVNPCSATQLAANIPSTEIHDSPTAIGATGGVLIQAAESLSIGAVFAYEPRFNVTENVKANQSYPGISDKTWKFPFNMPSHVGGGLAWRLNDRTLAAFDSVWVQYSSLVTNNKDAIVVFRDPASYTSVNIRCAPQNTNCLTTELATVSNGVDLHGGVEYEILTAPTPLFIRYGMERLAPHVITAGSCPPGAPTDVPLPLRVANFNDPVTQQRLGLDCTLQSQLYAGVTGTVGLSSATAGADNPDAINLAKAELGFSLGAGLVIGPKAQLDFAFVHTTYHRSDFIASMAVRF